MNMNKFIVSLLGISAFLILITISIFNDISKKDEIVINALGNLDSTLQRRYDLIPNLVATVKGYATHENKTLQAVIDARSQVGRISLDAKSLTDEKAVASFMEKQSQMQGAISRLLAVAEAYPDLKANANFLDLQHQLEGTENRINYSRNEFNKAVQDYNYNIRKFPNSLINGIFLHLDKRFAFKAVEEAQVSVKVDFGG